MGRASGRRVPSGTGDWLGADTRRTDRTSRCRVACDLGRSIPARARLLANWRSRFGDRIWAFTRQEAIAGGLFGDVRAEDVLVAFSFRRYHSQTVIMAREFRDAGGTVVGITDDVASPLARVSDVPLAVVTDSASYADSPTAAAAVAHILATLATASAKGARRRMEKRDHLNRILHLLEEDSE